MSKAAKETNNKNDLLGSQRTRLPARRCVICEQTLEEIGGKRIVAQQLRGIGLSDQYQGGGNKDYPQQSVKLYDDQDIYVLVWGEKNLWTPAAIQRAREAYQNGLHPWMCQLCAHRQCPECGQPINMPVGSDILYDNGCVSHLAMIPFDAGCINMNCSKYKDFSW